MLRRGLGLGTLGLGTLGRRRRELGRGKALRLSRGLRLRLLLSMGGAWRLSLRLCLNGGLRCGGRGLRHRLGTSGRLGTRGGLNRGLFPSGHLGLPRILGLRCQSVGDGRWLGGKLRMRRGPGLGRSLGLRGDLIR